MTTTIPIQPACAPTGGCGSCQHGEQGPVCQGSLPDAALPPVLQGPPAELDRVMAALGLRLGFEPGLLRGNPVRQLLLSPGEAELRLSVRAGCGASLADDAFDTLRRLLPDTDIFVRPVD